jgi:hypothetical protein
MNWKSSLFAVVAVAGLWAFWHFYEVKGGASRREKEEQSKKVFSGLETGSLTELSLQAEGAALVHLKKEGQDWDMDTPVAWKADSTQVENVLRQLKELNREETLEEKPSEASLAEFGLKEPSSWVAFKDASGTAREAWFGRKNPMGSDVYTRISGSAAVILVAGYNHDAILKKAEDLRDRAAWKFDPDQVTVLAAHFKDAAFKLFKDKQGIWQLQGGGESVDQSRVTSLLSQLSTLRIKDFVSEQGKGPARYGLGKGGERLELSLSGGREPLVLERGKQDASHGVVFGRVLGRPLIFSLESSSVVGNLAGQKDGLVDKRAFSVRPYEVQKVVVEAKGNSRTFEKKEGDWVRLPPLNPMPKEKPDVVDFLNPLSSEKYEGKPKAGGPLQDFEMKVSLYARDGKLAEELRFGPASKGKRQASSMVLKHLVQVSDSLLRPLPQ